MLNPSLTLANFIISRGTRRAWAAAQAIVGSPSKASRLLYLYGVSGTGKTHLLHAIGNAIQQADPVRRVQILTAEKFECDLHAAIEVKLLPAFRQGLCDGEVLLFDNLSFLRGRSAAQEELMNIIGCYQAAGRTVVVVGDVRTVKLEQMNASLVGLLAHCDGVCMRRPEPASRMAILKIKAEQLGIDLSDDVVKEIAACTPEKSVRDLVKKLSRLSAYAALFDAKIELPFAKQVFEENERL